jgi:hypothetical protein
MTGLCGFQGKNDQGYVVSKEKMTGLCGFQGEDDQGYVVSKEKMIRVMWFPRRK